MYYYHPHTGRFEQSTRSTVRSTTFGSPYYRRSLDDDVLYAPYRPSVLPYYSYDSSANEYATHSDISKELIMSSAAMDDNYDITNRSRQRDREVLAAANRAIVDTEVHSTPRGAVAAMRVARGHSTPPASNLSRSEAALYANKVEVNLPERKGRRPRSSYAQAKMRQLRKDKPMDDGEFETTATSVEATTGLKAHAPVRLLRPGRIWERELDYSFAHFA